MPGSFFDTNVLVYLASTDQAKADRSEALVAEGGTISVQVLNEVTNVLLRKKRLPWPAIHEFLGMLRELLTVHPLSVPTHDRGLAIAERYGLSTYDAMIAASAIEAECDRLWSEDMQHGMVLAGALEIVNPFREPS